MASRQARLDAWLRERALPIVQRTHFAELLELLKPVSESSLRHLLRNSGAALDPLVAGVDQDTLISLRDTLLDLAAVYEGGDAETRKIVRRIVITAKDHAKLASRNERVAAEKRELKREMADWMLTWLENPSVFPLWVALRVKSLKLDGNHL
ncbi:MAG: hypothetical protein HYX27_08965 [Acidobacteria bacterium]|nr:hypothetical protein [Acidobacteriota bacterium]